MNIKVHLLKENSRKNWEEVRDYIGCDSERFEHLIALFLDKDIRVVQRASQPIGMVAEKYPFLVQAYLAEFVTYLQTNPIDAVKRNVMRIFHLKNCVIPEELEGRLFDIALKYMHDMDEPIAIKSFSMTVARRICEKYPELVSEVIPIIELLVQQRVSSGIINRGNRELKILRKLQNQN